MHEIRKPLDALDNLLYLSFQKAGEPEAVRNYVRLAREQTATLSQISATVLDFARYSLVPKPTCLVAVAKAALRIHQKAIEAKKIHIVKNFPESLKAQVHSGEILQLVSNLVANALDALPPEGTVWLKLRKRRDQVHLVVADNGHGIPYEVVAQAFQPFFTTKGDRGTGIGLSLSRKVVDHHHGEIRLRSSVRPGKSGTMFKITLPA